MKIISGELESGALGDRSPAAGFRGGALVRVWGKALETEI